MVYKKALISEHWKNFYKYILVYIIYLFESNEVNLKYTILGRFHKEPTPFSLNKIESNVSIVWPSSPIRNILKVYFCAESSRIYI